MQGWADQIVFFEGEDAEALRTRFIELLAQFPRHDPIVLARYAFKGLREIEMRAGQAAQVWIADPEVLDRAERLRVEGPADLQIDAGAIERSAWQIANNPQALDKDRVSALTLLAKIKGCIKKEVEPGAGGGSEGGNADVVSKLAALLPA